MARHIYNGFVIATLALGVAAVTPACAIAQSAVAQPARANSEIPRARDGHPDFSGIWQTLSEADYDLEPHAGRRDAPPSNGVVQGGAIPYRAEAIARRRANFDHRGTDDPRLRCFALSVPRAVYYGAPFQILQRPDNVTLVHQFGNQVRDIATDGSLHPDDNDPQLWHGDSRGHWEGDTLVVDVTGFNEDTWLDRSGNYHSDKLHVVERWTFRDANTIDYSATLDDPEVYSKPWTINIQLNRREPGFKLIEDYCFTLEYADHYPHKDGQP